LIGPGPARIRAAAAFFAAAAGTGVAHAHELVPGVTGFPALVLHPIAVPDTALCLVAAGVAAGQGARPRLAPLGLAAGAAAAGVAVGFGSQFVVTGALSQLTVLVLLHLPLALAALAGLVVALTPRRAAGVTAAMVVLLGAMVGMLILPEAPGDLAVAEALAGAALGAALTVAVIAAPVALVTGRFGAVPSRVAGSWIAAAAILILAVALRGASQWTLGTMPGV
jgi:hypothetical protein